VKNKKGQITSIALALSFYLRDCLLASPSVSAILQISPEYRPAGVRLPESLSRRVAPSALLGSLSPCHHPVNIYLFCILPQQEK
jgi:hypothetical protein